MKKDPKKCTVAKFENDLGKKDEEIALQSRNVSAGVCVMGGTKLHTPTIQTTVKFRQVYLTLAVYSY